MSDAKEKYDKASDEDMDLADTYIHELEAKLARQEAVVEAARRVALHIEQGVISPATKSQSNAELMEALEALEQADE